MTLEEQEASDNIRRLEMFDKMTGIFIQQRVEHELENRGLLGSNDYVSITQEGDALVATVIRDK